MCRNLKSRTQQTLCERWDNVAWRWPNVETMCVWGEMLTQCCLNVGPPSPTAAQHSNDIGWTFWCLLGTCSWARDIPLDHHVLHITYILISRPWVLSTDYQSMSSPADWVRDQFSFLGAFRLLNNSTLVWNTRLVSILISQMVKIKKMWQILVAAI